MCKIQSESESALRLWYCSCSCGIFMFMCRREVAADGYQGKSFPSVCVCVCVCVSMCVWWLVHGAYVHTRCRWLGQCQTVWKGRQCIQHANSLVDKAVVQPAGPSSEAPQSFP